MGNGGGVDQGQKGSTVRKELEEEEGIVVRVWCTREENIRKSRDAKLYSGWCIVVAQIFDLEQ